MRWSFDFRKFMFTGIFIIFILDYPYVQAQSLGNAELDTIFLGSRQRDTICVGGKVHLSCVDQYDDKDILSYEWYVAGSNTVISNERELDVSPRTTTKYVLRFRYLSRSPELVKNGDFEQGNKSFTSDYEYVRTTTGWGGNKGKELYNEKTYVVGDNPHSFHPDFLSVTDHSGAGKMFICNGDADAARNRTVWKQNINVTAGVSYAFSAWVNWVNNRPEKVSPLLYFKIGDVEVPCYEENGGGISALNQGKWLQFYTTYKADRSGTITIYLKNKCFAADGNDFAVDDISFTPVKLIEDTVIVKVSPQIAVSQLVSPACCETDELLLEPEVYGSGTLKYDWSKWNAGVFQSVSNSPSLSMPHVELEDAGHYRLVVTGVCEPDTVEFDLKVWEKLRLRGKRHDTLSVCEGERVTFDAGQFTGYKLCYSWVNKYNGFQPASADSACYYKNSVEVKDAGIYLCSVRDSANCARDYIHRVLKVSGKPELLSAEVSENKVCKGDFVRFIASAKEENDRIIWENLKTGEKFRKNSGEAFDMCIQEEVKFRVMAVNGCDTSERRLLEVGVKPELTELNVTDDQKVCPESTVSLIAEVNPQVSGYITYEWFGAVSGMGPELVIAGLDEAKKGVYEVVVKDECGNELSDSVKIDIIDDFKQIEVSESQKVCLGNEVTFSALGGVYGDRFEWVSPGGRRVVSNVLHLYDVQARDTGVYNCIVTDGCNRTMSYPVRLSVFEDIAAWPQSPDTVLCAGESVEFGVNVSGENIHYEWYREGHPVGVSDQNLLLTRVTTADAGVYECVVTNGCAGQEIRVSNNLDVTEVTRFVAWSATQYVRPHAALTLFANAVGKNNEYVWDIGGRTVGSDATLHIADVGEAGLYAYRCVVHGECGMGWVTILVNVDDFIPLTADASVSLCKEREYVYSAELRPAGCDDSSGLDYLWKRDGKIVSEEKVIRFENLTEADEGEYICDITGACGVAQLKLKVEVLQKPELSALTSEKEYYCEGENIRLNAALHSTRRVLVSWVKDGNKRDETGLMVSVPDAKGKDSGLYVCAVSNVCGSDERAVSVAVKKSLQVNPLDSVLQLCQNESVKLSVRASGDDLTYAWEGPTQKNWTGSNEAEYVNTGITSDEAGRYRCVVGSACGTATIHRTVRVMDQLAVNATPDQQICPHSDQVLRVNTNLSEGVYWKWTLPDGQVVTQKDLVINDIRESGIYLYEVGNRCSVKSGQIRLQLYPEMKPLQIAADTNICEGGKVFLRAYAEGSEVTYRWMGPEAFSDTGKVVVLPHLMQSQAGDYEVTVTDICQGMQTGKMTVSIRKELEGIHISSDTAVCPGEDLHLRVEGGGEGVHYEWRLNGNLLGQGQVWSLIHPGAEDSGEYICRSTDRCGFREDTVQVKVLRPLVAEAIDGPGPVCPGRDVSFAVQAEGEEVNYVWRKGDAYMGMMQSHLDLPEVQLSDAGQYSCEVTSLCGHQEFAFTLEVLKPTVILGAPSYKHASKDEPEDLTVRADGEDLTYQWFRNGEELECTSSTFIQEPLNRVDSVYYTCIVSGSCGTDTVYMILDVGNYRLATSSPDTMCSGSSYSYLVEVVPEGCYGDEPTTYTWYKETMSGRYVIRDAGQILYFQNVQPEDAATYYCHVDRRPYCKDTVFSLVLAVRDAPEIHSISAVDSIVVEGENYSIRVDASGSELVYQWQKNGMLFAPPVRSPEIEFLPAKVSDSAVYTVTVTNKCGSFFRNSVLRVFEKTVVTSPRHNEIGLCYGQDTTLRVEASGKNLIYRWFFNDSLVGASNDNFYYTGVLKEGGEYRCEVIGRADADTAYFRLVVNRLPEVDFSGNLGICREEANYYQEYKSMTDRGVAYSWVFDGGSIAEGEAEQQVRVKWSGIGRRGMIRLTHTDLLTRCQSVMEKEVLYLDLPEVNLAYPDTVGYCLDSLALNQAWPSGGQYWINGNKDDVVKFYNKSEEYEIKYLYTAPSTGCSDTAYTRIGIAVQPLVRLEKKRDTTGRCDPLLLNIVQATPGRLNWQSKVELDTSDKYHALYLPAEDDEEVLYFQVHLSDIYGCTAEDYEYVLSAPLPRLNLPADQVVGKCDANKKVMEIIPDIETAWIDEIEWSPDTNVVVSGYRQAFLNFTTEGSYSYVMTVKDAFGCMDKDTMMITIINGPDIRSEEVCQGETIPVDCKDYTFVWSDGYSGASRLLRDTGSVQLRVVDKQHCVAEAVYRIHPLPQPGLPDTLLLVEGDKLDLRLELDGRYGPYRIQWQDGASGQVYGVGAPGEYEVNIEDALGCSSLTKVTVLDNIMPVTPLVQLVSVCWGEDTAFVVDIRGKVVEYNWYKNDVFLQSTTEPVLSLNQVRENAEYRCEVVGTHRKDSLFLELFVHELPRVKLPEDTLLGICRESISFLIEGEYTSSSPLTFSWSPEGKVEGMEGARGQIFIGEPGEYTYVLRVENEWGCKAEDRMNVKVEGPISWTAKEVCPGDKIEVDCSGYMFEWSDGYKENIRELRAPGVYVLSVVNAHGCVTDVHYAVHDLPEFDLPDTVYLYKGQVYRIDIDVSGNFSPYEVEWSDGTLGNSLEVKNEGVYKVKVKDELGCMTEKQVEVVKPLFYHAPNAFLPGSAGENSRFYMKDVNFSAPFEMYIYNRWGEMVYKTSVIGFDGGWDGKYNGEDCLPGAYLWVAYSGGKVLGKGTLVLIR